MDFRARKTASDEDGFIIIEVLVSALILAIVAGAVLTLITATTRGAAVQRDRAVANDLAQADQARMRTLLIAEISGTESNTKYPVVNGTRYAVESKRAFVPNKSGAVSCASASVPVDYVKLTTTVSSTSMQNPVVVESVVSPSTGSLSKSKGTLTATAANANAIGEPVAGILVTARQTENGAKRSATTGAEGCVNFVNMPSGAAGAGTKYEVTYTSSSLVNPAGEGKSSEKIEMTGAYKTVPTTPSLWDSPVTITPNFVYVDANGVKQSAPGETMFVANTTNGYERAVGAPGVTPTPALSKVVFPFESGEYTAFAGYCATNNPGTSTANKVGLYSAMLTPGQKVTPEIRLPRLELTVTTKSLNKGKEGTEQLVSGANVTLTDRNCTYSGSKIIRTYMTNASGSLSNKVAVEKNAATAPSEPAVVPYSTYEICASATINKEARYAKVTEQKVQDFTGKGTAVRVNLEGMTTAC